MVSVSRVAAGAIMVACLTLGLLLGIATTTPRQTQQSVAPALRGGTELDRQFVSENGVIAARPMDSADRKLAGPWEDLVWPTPKKTTVNDGWGPAEEEVFEIQRLWPEDLNEYMEVDMSMSYFYEM